MRIILLTILAVAGCSGPPTRFYTLAPEPQTRLEASACDAAPLAVSHVMLPASLDRDGIVRASGPGQLQIASEDRWAAPLDGMVQHALAEDLRELLPPARVLLPGDPAPPGDRAEIEVNVSRFLADRSGRVLLEADWTLLDAHGARAAGGAETLSRTTASTTDAVVIGMSETVGMLADRIADALSRCLDRTTHPL